MNIDHVTTRHGTLCVHRHIDDGPTLVALHGFTLGGAMFHRFGDVAGRPLAAPNLPGHGGTTVPATLDATVEALAEWLTAEHPPHHVLGYSLGGRTALHLAERHPELVASLVVVSAGPGLPESERVRRRRGDEALAERIERVGITAFVDEWLAMPLIAEGKGTDSMSDLRHQNTAEGLASALRGLGQGTVPMVDLASLRMPMLWVAGAKDPTYAEIATRAATMTGGELLVIPEVGHNVVATAPEILAAATDDFTTRLMP